MARGPSRAQSELRSAGPDKGPNRKLDAEQAEEFKTLLSKQASDGWVGTAIPLKALAADERANLMAHLEQEKERFLENYEVEVDEDGEQTEDNVGVMLGDLADAEPKFVEDFFKGKSQYTNFGKLEPADQKAVTKALKEDFNDSNPLTSFTKFRATEAAAENVAKIQSRMDSITVAEYTRISDAGTVDLMKHNTYDKWMRSTTGGKEYVKTVIKDAALAGVAKSYGGQTFERAAFLTNERLKAADAYEKS